MPRFLAEADALLRGRLEPVASEAFPRRLATMLACVVVFGLAYGSVMGCFGGVSSDRLLQVVYSAAKVPLLLLTAFALGLPSFFVVNTLCGLRDDFLDAVRALAATQAGLTMILSSLAPLTALWYLSVADYRSAVVFNGVMFAVASVSAQVLLRRHYRPLIARHPRHRWMMLAWLLVYCFVGIQMGWILRPFIGDPNRPPEFFRSDAFDENAYVVVVNLIWRVLFAVSR